MDEETFSFDVTRVIRDSGQALLVATDDLDEPEVWIPQSQICDESEVWKEGQCGTMVVKRWFAKKREWVDE